MPLYDYQCKCGHSEELLFSFSEFAKNKKIKCPACSKKTLKVIISADSLVVKNQPLIRDCKTVGQLAEQNVKKKGKYWAEDMDRKSKPSKKRLRKALDGFKPREKDYRPLDAESARLMSATRPEVETYIEKGILPKQRRNNE